MLVLIVRLRAGVSLSGRSCVLQLAERRRHDARVSSRQCVIRISETHNSQDTCARFRQECKILHLVFLRKINSKEKCKMAESLYRKITNPVGNWRLRALRLQFFPHSGFGAHNQAKGAKSGRFPRAPQAGVAVPDGPACTSQPPCIMPPRLVPHDRRIAHCLPFPKSSPLRRSCRSA